MALDAAIKCVGSVQGPFKHQNGIKSRAGFSIVTWSKHGVNSPRDVATGQASGKRQHEPFECRLLLDSSIINFYSAISTNEVLKSVTIQFYQTVASGLNLGSAAGAGGESKPAMTVLLENAVVSDVEYFQPYSRAVEPEEKHKDQHMTVKFTYQKITITWTDGGVTYVDDWTVTS
jgi:type VI secretion system secreted protein Hcp